MAFGLKVWWQDMAQSLEGLKRSIEQYPEPCALDIHRSDPYLLRGLLFHGQGEVCSSLVSRLEKA